MNLNELQPAEGSKFAPKRVGRGIGSGTSSLARVNQEDTKCSKRTFERSSEQGRRANALALGADERRDKLR